MAIKASSTEATRSTLCRADGKAIDDDSTWVEVRPITFRDDIRRGELLRRIETVYGADGSMTQRADVNNYALMAEELWLTYHNANIVIVAEDGEESNLFKPRDETSRDEFMGALGELPSYIVTAWRRSMLKVNPEWAVPF